MKKINSAFIIASLIILLIAIGSVFAVSDNAVISDGDDSDNDDEEDIELDEGDDSEDESYDGEFDGEASPLSAGASLDSAKGMSMNAESGLDNGSQGNVNSNHQAGNPIAILLLSLLSLIAIPLRNR